MKRILHFLLIFLIILVQSKSSPIPKIDFIYKDKIIPFKENPIITEKEIYFSQEDFVIFMKSLGFVDWEVKKFLYYADGFEI
ncbi:MAG: hypothetical protein ACK4GR_05255 [bacterium]